MQIGMSTTIAPADVAVACLSAARSAAAEGADITAAWYLATSRSAIDAASEQVERLRANLKSVEAELVRRGMPKQLEMKERNERNDVR